MNTKNYGEIDFVAYLKSTETKKAKVDELNRQAKEEYDTLKEKYKEVLREYEPASEKMQLLVKAFNDEWDDKLRAYRKEKDTITKKYKKIFKQL